MPRRPPAFSLLDVDSQEEALVVLAQMVADDLQGASFPEIRRTAIKIVRRCNLKDRSIDGDVCQLSAIFDAVKNGDSKIPGLKDGLAYMSDQWYVDNFVSPSQLLRECADGACAEDCLPLDTLVVGAGYKLRPIGELKVGDVIMGDGAWTRVTKFWDKGEQDLLAFRLSNGCVLRCTAGHKLFRVRKVPSSGKLIAGDRNDVEEIRADEVKPGDDLLTADKLPFGSEDLGVDKSWLLGVHVADGWCDDMGQPDGIARRASISGKDGHRKEGQKRRVQSICDKLGIATRWHERYIVINDRPTAQWLAAAGHTAINKHVPSLDLTEQSVRPLLEGLSADAAVDTGTFGTISPTLAIQLRLLHRMLGIKTSIRRVDEHGGLGKNPIYRVQPFDPETLLQRGKFARVRAIEECEPAPTCDIEVEGSRFYLPETDLIVHNCDSHGGLVAALAAAIGFRVGIRAWGASRGSFEHIYAVAIIPKDEPDLSKCYEFGLDTSADVGDSRAGWQPNEGNVATAWIGPEDFDRRRAG